jgi:hypothetical protein
MELSIGHYLTLANPKNTAVYRFQNFHIGQTGTYGGQSYGFLPFGFSGVSINRTGDNTEANLVLPNNEISRNWALDAIRQNWIGTVFMMLLNPDDRADATLLTQYVGQVAGGAWEETTLSLKLNTILDAVGTDVPMRRITQNLVGSVPVSANVQLR